MKNLQNVGIETGIHYKPIHHMSFYKNSIDLPISNLVSKEIVSIPLQPHFTNSEIDFIIKSVNKFC